MTMKFHLLLSFYLLCMGQNANAQLLDAIRGHAQDLRVRFDDHQKIEGEVIKRGQIDKTAKGQDLIHNSSGEWSVVKVGNQLFLQSSENFRSSPGPDYHVYISSKSAIKDNEEFSAQQIEVSRLKKPNGAAFYLLPTQKPEDVMSMLIWCKQFKEYIVFSRPVTFLSQTPGNLFAQSLRNPRMRLLLHGTSVLGNASAPTYTLKDKTLGLFNRA